MNDIIVNRVGAFTVIAECFLEYRRQYLRNGLFNRPVYDCRYPQFPSPSIWLWYLNPLDRLRPIGPAEYVTNCSALCFGRYYGLC